MIKFQVGQEYSTRSACDYDCIFTIKIIKRTAKMITFEYLGEVKRCKVREYRGAETAFALGTYSMCPVFTAD